MANELRAEFIGVLPVYKNADGQICIGFPEAFADDKTSLEESIRVFTRGYDAGVLNPPKKPLHSERQRCR